jgi:Flp pilus assembly protein TadG
MSAGPARDARGAGNAGAARDAGSLALELAVLAPALLAIIGLLFTYGRYAQVSGVLEAASRDAARAATQARSLDEARDRVDTITRETLRRAPGSCQDSATDEIVGGVFQPGMNVTVEVRCTVSFSDLGAWGVPGDVTVVRRFASPLDPYRAVR